MSALEQHVALLECSDPTSLDEMLAAGVQRFVVRRLGPRVVVVDHERLEELRKLLKKLGQTPRVTVE